ncbi:MAG: nickel pincer cofactor biosynthesis protein LarC [Candidatus Lokiarchaeota archaeon]|nr:nickel pincer cofactor biosynthesis protein LarC [Candidatus Lokiarchaeota archaeon]
MKSLYIDATNSGISGDMFLASLLGLNDDPDKVFSDLKELKSYLNGVSDLNLKLYKVKRMGVEVNRLKLLIKESKNHRIPDELTNALERYLDDKQYSKPAKKFARNVLNTLFKAEAEVHGDIVENIHLHELSSVDTLIDILGVTKALDNLGGFTGDFTYYCSEIPLGGGNIKTAHGILPVPAPATVKIFEQSKLVVKGGPIESELVTPTGAALLVNLNPIFSRNLNQMNLINVSSSTGQKEFKNFSNVLRLFYGELKEQVNKQTLHPLRDYVQEVVVLETAVDDVSGEILGNFVQALEDEEILDVQIIPSLTKKNRPGHIIKILCDPKHSFDLIYKTLLELGTLGVRFYTTKRVCIDRKFEKCTIEINGVKFELKLKISYIQSRDQIKIINVKPEFEDLRRISKQTNLPIKEVLIYCQSEIEKQFRKNS